jgi:hypothetical protein
MQCHSTLIAIITYLRPQNWRAPLANLEPALNVGGELKLVVALGGDLSLIDYDSGDLVISAAYSPVWEQRLRFSSRDTYRP